MSASVLSVFLGRRWACLLAGTRRMLAKNQGFSLAADVPQETSPGAVLGDLLGRLPTQWRACEVRIALSPALLGCSDAFETPFTGERQMAAVASSLAEERCAGENAEQLSVDFAFLDRKTVEIVAVRTDFLRSLVETVRSRLPGSTVTLIASAPSLLARALAPEETRHGLALGFPGEAWVFEQGSILARTFPLAMDRDRAAERLAESLRREGQSDGAGRVLASWTEDPRVRLKSGIECPLAHAIPTALALADTETLANLVSALPGHSSGARQLRRAYLGSMAAAAVLFLAMGLYFDQRSRGIAEQSDRCARSEEALWKICFPSDRYVPDALADRMRSQREKRRKAAEANRLPSALAFWGQVGSRMPQPDRIGFSLDELSLAPDGGRLAGRVRTEPGDPLRNASLLERSLNESEALDARGEFETKGDEIVVRMRLDYQPRL